MKTQVKKTAVEQMAAQPKGQLHDILRDSDGKFQFQFFGEDGSVVLFSQTYRTERDAQKGLDSVLRNLPKPERYQFFEKEGQFHFLLFAGNREEIAHSCPFLSEKTAKTAAQFLQNALNKTAGFQPEAGRIELESTVAGETSPKTADKNLETTAVTAEIIEKNKPASMARHSFRLDLYPTDDGGYHARAEHPESGDSATFDWGGNRFERFEKFVAQKLPPTSTAAPVEILTDPAEQKAVGSQPFKTETVAVSTSDLHELFKKSPAEFIKKITETEIKMPISSQKPASFVQKLPNPDFSKNKENNELGLLNPTNQPTDFLQKQQSNRFLLALKTPSAINPIEAAVLEIRKFPEGDFVGRKTLFLAMQTGPTGFFQLPKIDIPAGIYRFELAGLASTQLTIC